MYLGLYSVDGYGILFFKLYFSLSHDYLLYHANKCDLNRQMDKWLEG